MPDPSAILQEAAADFRAAGRIDLAESAENYAGMAARGEEPSDSEVDDLTRLLRLAQHPSVREAKADK